MFLPAKAAVPHLIKRYTDEEFMHTHTKAKKKKKKHVHVDFCI